MITTEQLRAVMTHVPTKKGAELLPFLNDAMREFSIDAPPRAAAFLAQLAHESGELRFMEELWGPTDAQQRYEPVSALATRLGNVEAGDGKRFKGRGPIQLTGRANYQRFGTLLNTDLIADPPRAAKPDTGFRIAALFWSKKGLNELADIGSDEAFIEITRRINGGRNGLSERQAFWAIAKQILGVPTGSTRGLPRSRARKDLSKGEPEFTRGWETIRAVRARRTRARKAATPKKARAIAKRRSPRKARR